MILIKLMIKNRNNSNIIKLITAIVYTDTWENEHIIYKAVYLSIAIIQNCIQMPHTSLLELKKMHIELSLSQHSRCVLTFKVISKSNSKDLFHCILTQWNVYFKLTLLLMGAYRKVNKYIKREVNKYKNWINCPISNRKGVNKLWFNRSLVNLFLRVCARSTWNKNLIFSFTIPYLHKNYYIIESEVLIYFSILCMLNIYHRCMVFANHQENFEIFK